MTQDSHARSVKHAREIVRLMIAGYVSTGQFKRQYAKWRSGTVTELIARAPQDVAAYDTLVTLLRNGDSTMPGFDDLREWAAQRLERNAKKPPRNRAGGSAYFMRDSAIVRAIEVAATFGLSPTRNESTESRRSACDVVVLALKDLGVHTTYDVVKKVWHSRQKPSPWEKKSHIQVS